MNRYQFELLSFLEKNGAGCYSIRTLADSLAISGDTVRKCLKELQAFNWISKKENYISITDTGLLALEPYRVKKAVIMAAGFGSRMVPVTLDRPKPLVKVNGVRIVDTLLDALVSVGITDITIVRGYKKECFEELKHKYPFLKFVDNDIYNETNNISSAMAALESVDTCYLCEADLYITNPAIITKYQYCSNILGSWALETDDWCFRRDKSGFIQDYQKGNTNCYSYYGISYWTREDSVRLRKDFCEVFNGENGTDYFWEFIPLVLKRENYGVEIRQCRREDIIEIDNFYELVEIDPSYQNYPVSK